MSYPKEQGANPLSHFGALAHQVPIADIVDDTYVLTDGSLAVVYRIAPFKYASEDEAQIVQWDRMVRAMLNSMSPNLNMKVLYRSHHSYRDVLEEYVKQADGKNPFARFILLEEAGAWRAEMENRRLIRNDVLVAFTFRPKQSLWRSPNIVKEILTLVTPGGAQRVGQRTKENHRKALAQLDEAVQPVLQTINIANLRPVRLDNDALAQLAYEILNPNRSLALPGSTVVRPTAKTPHYGQFASPVGQQALKRRPHLRGLVPKSIREQLCFSDWRVTDQYVESDGMYHAVISMRIISDAVEEGMILNLCNMPFALTLTADVMMLDKDKEQQALWRSARMAESVAGAKILQGSAEDPAQREKATEQRNRYLQLAQAGENPFLFRLLITVSAESGAQLSERCNEVISAMRRMHNMNGVREQFFVDTLLKSSWPFGLVTDVNTRTLMTSEASTLLPFFGAWEGSERPSALFRDSDMRLVKYDPFSNQIANRNKITVGKSGAGKSVTSMLADVLPMLARDTEVLVVDSNASFLTLCHAVDGAFVRAGPRSNKIYNVFDIPKGYLALPDVAVNDELTKEAAMSFKISSIADLVMVMAGITTDRETARAKGALSGIIQEVYQPVLARLRNGTLDLVPASMPLLGDLHRAMGAYQNPDDRELQGLVKQIYNDMKQYVHADGDKSRPGIYARIFDTHTNFDPDEQMIVFEMGEVKDNKALMNPLALVLITGLIYGRVMRRDKPRLVVLDEAWALLEHPAARSAILRFFREGRKLQASIQLLTQTISDVVLHPDADAMLSNASSIYYLPHLRTPSNTKAMQSLGLNARKIEMIYGGKQVKGFYAELMLKIDESWAFVRLEPTSLKYWCASSAPEDLKVRDEYLDLYHKHYGLHWREVLIILAADYPRGIANTPATHRKLSEYEALTLAAQLKQHLADLSTSIRSSDKAS